MVNIEKRVLIAAQIISKAVSVPAISAARDGFRAKG